MALPIQYAVPELMKLSDLDSAMPDGTTSKSIRVTPSNLSSIVSPTYTTPAQNVILPDSAFNSQNVMFDIPCLSNSWIDTRQSTISFRVIYEALTTGTTYRVATAPNLRGGAFSYWDGLQVLGPAGNVLESISEMGIIYNALTQFQMSNSDRDGNALQYGFFPGTQDSVVKGHEIPFLGTTTADLAATTSVSFSYSYPFISSVIGTGASKMFPIGAIPKLQVVLTSTNILPLTHITSNQEN
jgi:hypothetical protein